MNPRIKSSVITFFLLLICLSAGVTKGSSIGTSSLDLLHNGGVGANSRKLMGFNAVSDYEYAGANPKHDPRRRGGGGSKNP